jgi:hypothetical protein
MAPMTEEKWKAANRYGGLRELVRAETMTRISNLPAEQKTDAKMIAIYKQVAREMNLDAAAKLAMPDKKTPRKKK